MAAEVAIILLLIRGRVYRSFPAFSLYLCWSLFSDGLLYLRYEAGILTNFSKSISTS